MPRAPRQKTRYPGVYRRGASYEYIYRDARGEQRAGTEKTLDKAKKAKARKEDEARTGFTADTTLTLASYVLDVIERYQGRTSRGFREETRDEYRRQLQQYVIRYFGPKQKLIAVTPKRVADFLAWLVKLNVGTKAKPKYLSDATIQRIKAALAVCMATAVEEGLIPSNPCVGVRLPNRPKVEDDADEPAKALTREELAAVLACAPVRFVLLLSFLAVTGLRISEALAVRWKDLTLDGPDPKVRVRRAYVKGRFGPPKSKFGKRDVPLPGLLVEMLRKHRRESEHNAPNDLVFCMSTGKPWGTGNLWKQSVKAAGEKAGVPWIGFHVLRHTCATLLFAEGRNAVQVQRWLGHHSPAFTLATYIHLLDNDLGGPLDLPSAETDGEIEAHLTASQLAEAS